MSQLVEVFESNLPLSEQNLSLNAHVTILNDRLIHSDVLSITNNGKILIPKYPRTTLQLHYKFLYLQAFIPTSKFFSVEIETTDGTSVKRKLIFTHCREILKNSLTARLPQSVFIKDRWVNFSVDLQSFISECWGVSFEQVDSISVYGSCRIRKIAVSDQEELLEFPGKILKQKILPGTELGSPRLVSERKPVLPKQINPKHNIKEIRYFDKKIIPIIRKESPLRGVPYFSYRPEKQRRTIFQEKNYIPEIHGQKGFFDAYFKSLTKIRHETPPLVNTEEGLFYDPVNRNYANM